MRLGIIGKANCWLSKNYGARRGFISTYLHRFLNFIGKYRKYRTVDMQSIDRVVFVCKGNICRSAFAEAVAKSAGINAISCGLITVEDAPANKDAIEVAKKLGYDMRMHRTTPIMYLVLRKTDLLVAMEPWQADALCKNLKRRYNVTLLGLWSSSVRPHIHDPYGLSSIYFNNCFKLIESSVYEIAKKIKHN